MNVLITDAEYPDLELEREILDSAGLHMDVAQCRTPEQVIAAGQHADALMAQYAPITRAVMEQLPRVRIVSRYGVGVDTVDLEAARELGVWVCNVPDYGVEEVASHATAMMLTLVRHLAFYDRDVRDGRWHYLSAGALQRPSTLSVGVVGMGRIGREVARRAEVLFGGVLGFDPLLPDTAWPAAVERTELEALFARSQLVSLHLPLTPETHGLVNSRMLARMPDGSYLVNTARGGLIDLDDLLAALDRGQLAGAALDVLPHEPPPANHPVVRHPRVLLSPHAAWYSEQAGTELRRKVARNVVAWAREGRPLYSVVEGQQTASPRGSP